MKSNKKEEVRQFLITRHNSLFYKPIGNKVLLLDFFDTRQDRKKIFIEYRFLSSINQWMEFIYSSGYINESGQDTIDK